MAVAEIERAQAEGRVPIIVGGTGLYLRALVEGLAPVPPVPASVRAEARALHGRLGGPAFRDALAALDPEAARRLAAGDAHRLIRAFEVVTATGQPLSAWQRRQGPAPHLPAAAVVLLPPRQALFAACNARFLAMVEAGAPAEVRALVQRGLAPTLPAMKAVGVRELAAWLDGRLTREAAVAAAQQATRRYAKRQYTWFRHQLPETGRFEKMVVTEQFSESLGPEIFAFIRHFLLTINA
jgi:tRNA dimethylallyltransferase